MFIPDSVLTFPPTGSQPAAGEERWREGRHPSHGDRQNSLCAEQLPALSSAEGQSGQQNSVQNKALVSFRACWQNYFFFSFFFFCLDWKVFPACPGERKVSRWGRSVAAIARGVCLCQRVSIADEVRAVCLSCCCFCDTSGQNACSSGIQVLRQHRNLPEDCSTEAHAPQPADGGYAQSR